MGKKSAGNSTKPMFEPHGARATSLFGSPPAIQAKLMVGEHGDRFEREADAVADAVVQRKSPKCAECGQEDAVRLQAGSSSPESSAQTAGTVHRGLAAQRGAGEPLDTSVRQEIEHGIGADFSGVRIHTGARAAELNDMLQARAFTHGQDVFFNSGEFDPGSNAGRHLLAHELTHVVQQSRATGGVPSMQRGPKPGSTVDKLQKAKDELKSKFGLQDVSEINGVAWTEGQLKKIAAVFSKMSIEEQERLKGVTLLLTDKFPSKRLKGKRFTIAGTTYGTYRIELTAAGVREAALHEVGHLIHNTAIANAEKLFARSQFKADLETARAAVNQDAKRRFIVPPNQPQINEQLKAVVDAAAAFERSGDDDRKANRQALEDTEMMLPTITPDASSRELSAHIDKVRAFVAALLRWSDEREKAVGPVKRLDEFVGIVTKHKLARRSAIFTPYAEANWPDKPAEFFSEAYEAWRRDPAEVKRISKDLAAWFEKGGHLGPKIPPPRPPIKIPIPTEIPAMHKDAPVIEELLIEAGHTFLPAVEGGANLVDMIVPLPLPRVP